MAIVFTHVSSWKPKACDIEMPSLIFTPLWLMVNMGLVLTIPLTALALVALGQMGINTAVTQWHCAEAARQVPEVRMARLDCHAQQECHVLVRELIKIEIETMGVDAVQRHLKSACRPRRPVDIFDAI